MVSQEAKDRAREFYRVIGGKLREHGFRGSGRNWYLKHDFATICVGVVTNHKYGLSSSFTFAMGLAIEHLYELYPKPVRPQVPKWDYCHFEKKIGWLNEHFNPDPLLRRRYDGKMVIAREIPLRVRAIDANERTNIERLDRKSLFIDEDFELSLEIVHNLLVNIGLPLFSSWQDRRELVRFLKARAGMHYSERHYWSWLAKAVACNETIPVLD